MLFYTGWKHLKKRGRERKSFKAMEGKIKGNREREGPKKLLGKGGGGGGEIPTLTQSLFKREPKRILGKIIYFTDFSTCLFLSLSGCFVLIVF